MMEMIKKNWGKIVLTSAVVLAASLAGGVWMGHAGGYAGCSSVVSAVCIWR